MMETQYGAVEKTPINGLPTKKANGFAKHEKITLPYSFYHSPRITEKTRAVERYDPSDWRETILSVAKQSYASTAFLTMALIGSALVLVSALPMLEVPSNVRDCRAWCSRLSLGSQAHSYVGIVLFLIMAFRNNTAVANYQSGLRAFYSFKASIRTFVNVLVNRVPRDSIPVGVRARALGLATVFPYCVMLDMREERFFAPGTIDGVLSEEDLGALEQAPTLPEHVVETLTELVETEIAPHVPMGVANAMQGALSSLVTPYTECERIKQNPCVLSYIAHLRALLIAYLITLPLALVEQMGFSTIPVTIVVTYSLMSLEMLAVDIENPFGDGKSDLPLGEHCQLLKEQALESWQRWMDGPIKNATGAKLYVEAAEPTEQVLKIELE